MPKFFEDYLKQLNAHEKAELGHWILTNPNDNEITTLIIEVIDPAQLAT